MPEEIELRRETVCFPKNQKGEYLLGLKFEEKNGGGRRNGFGGGLEGDEDFSQAAVRELGEEAGFFSQVEDLEHVASSRFFFHERGSGKVIKIRHVEFYVVTNWVGNLRLSSEFLGADWFTLSDFPWGEMWPADQVMLPRVLSGDRRRWRVHFRRTSAGWELERYFSVPL